MANIPKAPEVDHLHEPADAEPWRAAQSREWVTERHTYFPGGRTPAGEWSVVTITRNVRTGEAVVRLNGRQLTPPFPADIAALATPTGGVFWTATSDFEARKD